MQRHLFFFRVATALKSEHQIFFSSSEPLSILMARLGGFNGKHLSKKEKCTGVFSRISILEAAQNSIEVLNGVFTNSEAARDIELIAEGLYAYIKEQKIQKVVIWNGQQLIGRAAKLAALKTCIPCQYLELSNLPGKLFADPEGVNALSSIARNIDIIDQLPAVPEALHKEWLDLYESEKKKPLPQARKSTKEIILSILNYGAKRAFNSTCIVPLRKKRKVFFTPPTLAAKTSSYPHPKDYIFLPLQVSSDTQIKLHSKYSNLDAIRYAHMEAQRKGLALIVKIHPAENDPREFEAVKGAQDKLGFLVSTQNTVELIQGATAVITINSTVGMEALLYGKPVTALGQCLYKKFNEIRLKKYIHCYLVSDIEYFSSAQINSSSAKKLIE